MQHATSNTFDCSNLRRGSEYMPDVSDADYVGKMSYDEAIARLQALGSFTRDGKSYQCPAHDDREPSLSVSEGEDDRLLMTCHAGCEFEDILDALRDVDLDEATSFPRPTHPSQIRARAKVSKIPSEQELHKRRKALCSDSRAVLNAEKHRKIGFETFERFGVGVHTRSGLHCLSLEVQEVRQKTIRDLEGDDPYATTTMSATEVVGVMSIDPRPSKTVEAEGKIPTLAKGHRGLFPAPEEFDGQHCRRVVIVEGELDALAVNSLGFYAVGLPGANIWDDAWAQRFERFEEVVIIGDCDTPGRKAVKRVAHALSEVTKVSILDLDPERDDGSDVGDYIMDGCTDRTEFTKQDLELWIMSSATPFVGSEAAPPPFPPPQDSLGVSEEEEQLDRAVSKEVRRMRIHEEATKRRAEERIEESMNQSNSPITTPIGEMPYEELEFLMKPYLPIGTFVSVQGPGGIGKSSFTSWIAAQLTNGSWGAEGAVIHIGDEDHHSRVFDRLTWLDADTTKYHYWQVDEHLITFPSGTALLERRIGDLDVKLVIIDTATEYLDEGYDINVAQDVTNAIKPLRGLAQRTGCAIIGVSHLNREKASDPSKLAGASKAWYDRSKSALFLGRDPDVEEYVHVFHAKHNFTNEGAPLQFEAHTLNGLFKLEYVCESDREFSEVFNCTSAPKETKTELTDQFLQTYEGSLPIELQELTAAFLEQYGEDAVTDPISLKTLEKRRTQRGWVSRRVKGTQYAGRLLDFKSVR